WLFSAALLVTLPLFTSVMVVNMSFGVMSRSAPQMNVFTVGFPITLIFGLLLMWFSLSNFLPLFELLLAEGFVHLTELTECSNGRRQRQQSGKNGRGLAAKT